MPYVKTDSQYYTAIANAIRSKNGLNMQYLPSQMADAILAIETSGVPAYWDNTLNQSIATIRGRTGFKTAFLTDIHWEDNNKKSPALLKEIMLNTGLNSAVCGGDLIVQQPTKAAAITMMQEVVNKFGFANMAFCVGNHDLNSEESSDTSVYLTYEELKDIIGDSGGVTWFTHSSSGDATLFGYRDHADEKIREVFLNTGAPTLSGDDSHFSTSLGWAYDGLKSLPSDWGVIIYAHKYWQPTGHMVTQNPAQYITSYLNSRMSHISAEIIAIITGHCHDDYYTYDPTYGYLIMSTTTDSGTAQAQLDEVNKTRTPGTTLEQAFDVITVDRTNKILYADRIGAGTSRALPYHQVTGHSVTGNYTHVTNSNAAVTVQDGASYSATLTAEASYTIDSVVVTMGGVNITSTAYNSSTGAISIASVTGDIVITAVASKAFVNAVSVSQTSVADATVFDGIGYRNNAYLSNYTTYTNSNGFVVTGVMPWSLALTTTPSEATPIYVYGVTDGFADSHNRFGFIHNGSSVTTLMSNTNSVGVSGYFDIETLGTNYYKLTPKSSTVRGTFIAEKKATSIEYIQCSFKCADGAGLVIGLGEEIPSSYRQ